MCCRTPAPTATTAIGVLFHGCGEAVAVYNCPHKQVDGMVVSTNTVPAGAFRGYGLSQTVFAMESAMDELAHRLGMDPFALRRRNAVADGDPMIGYEPAHADIGYGSYGLDQCLDLVEQALAEGGEPAPPGWLVGQGMALAMIDTVPPRGPHGRGPHPSRNPTGTSTSRSAPRSSATAPARCTANSPPPCWAPSRPPSGCASPTPTSSATTPAPMARPEPWSPAPRRCARPRRCGAAIFSRAATLMGMAATGLRLELDEVVGAGARLPLAALAPLQGEGRFDGTPRSIAFNVHGFRVAVHPDTGELKILRSVQAADAGTVVNPMQCRGQVEGGVAQAIGATLYEALLLDATGRVTSRTLRGYHIPHLRGRAAHRGAVRPHP